MKKFIISLILFLPFIVNAQNDSIVNVTLQRMYGEITDKAMYSLNSFIIGEYMSDMQIVSLLLEKEQL